MLIGISSPACQRRIVSCSHGRVKLAACASAAISSLDRIEIGLAVYEGVFIGGHSGHLRSGYELASSLKAAAVRRAVLAAQTADSLTRSFAFACS